METLDKSMTENEKAKKKRQKPFDRNISDGNEKHLFDELSNHKKSKKYKIIIPRKKNTPAREATINVKFKEVIIEPPNNLINKSTYSKITMYAVSLVYPHNGSCSEF
jgi:hypothetical protein